MQYLDNKPWSEWTRDERFFCSVLYHEAQKDVKGFGEWLCAKVGLEYTSEDEWDLGYEVCFYRDYLWPKKRSAREEGLPAKRTFREFTSELQRFKESAVKVG